MCVTINNLHDLLVYQYVCDLYQKLSITVTSSVLIKI